MSGIRGVHLAHFRIFCELISRKCELRFCVLNTNFPKYSINFTNLSSSFCSERYTAGAHLTLDEDVPKLSVMVTHS